jgi:hypothetical protein
MLRSATKGRGDVGFPWRLWAPVAMFRGPGVVRRVVGNRSFEDGREDPRVKFRVTVRWGKPGVRYHVAEVEGVNLAEALRQAADLLPDDVAESADLAELRPAPDPEEREYLGG